MHRNMHTLKVRSEGKEGKAYYNEIGKMFPTGDGDDWVVKLHMQPEVPIFVFKDKEGECYTPKVRSEGKDDKSYWNPVGKMFKSRRGGFNMKLHMHPELLVLIYEDKPKEEEPPAYIADDDDPYSTGEFTGEEF